MEIYELKYFLGVAQYEHVHKAAQKLHISPASLSKAVSRLEKELGISLFAREQRNIKLTPQGRLLQQRAREMIHLEESIRYDVTGSPGNIHAVISGPEILLAKFGTVLGEEIRKTFPTSSIEFSSVTEEEALRQVEQGEAHLAVVSGEVNTRGGITSKVLLETKFQTYVGATHPLFARAKSKKPILVDEILKFSFVSPDNPFLGKVDPRQSLDGWRDDQFPRKVKYLTASLKILEELVTKGRAIAYLPSYFCENLSLEFLKITGCPYTCVQKIKLVSRRSQDLKWLNEIFERAVLS